jgi:opacity protein-like surface antigen
MRRLKASFTKKFRGTLIGLTFVCSAHKARANDIFDYQGAYTHASGGAGVTMSRSGEAILHNPANLWASPTSDAYVDFAPTNLKYQVTTPSPNIKPGTINVPVLPLTSVGGSVKGYTGPLSFGYMFVPTGVGSTVKVEDFPIAVNGQYQTATINSTQKGFRFGIGSAYKVMPNLCLGFSIMNQFSSNSTKISVGGQDFLELENKSSSLHLAVGVRYEIASIATLGFIFRPSTDMHYTLKLKALGSDTQSFYRRDYRPTLYGAGVHSKPLGRFEPYLQYSYERWTPATFYAQAPTQAVSGTAPVEYLNTHSYVIGSRYALHASRHLSFAYSHFTKNKGSGIMDPSGQVAMQGRGAQDFEALDRTHLTAGLELNTKPADWLIYSSYIHGTAESPENTPSAGFYEMTALMVGLGYVSK